LNFKSGQNKMTNLYERLDNGIMRGVNAGVRAWNWTTGRTRADLANLFVAGTIIGLSVGGIYSGSILAIINPALSLALGHQVTKRYREIDEEEVKANNEGLMSFRAEKMKEFASYAGPALIVLNCVGLNISEDVSTWFLSGGGFSQGLSFYVMRADYLPPRKNCVSRALDYLAESLRQPVPVPAGVYCRGER
jgi:hypothetical protein